MYTPRPFVPVLAAALAVLLYLGCTTEPPTTLAAEYINLGNAYAELGRFEQAVGFYQRALELDQSFPQARFNLAYALIQAGRHAEAETILTALQTADPGNAAVQELLAYAYHQRGEDQLALDAYTLLLELAPGNTDARYNLGILAWKLGEAQLAADHFLTVLSVRPQDVAALSNLAELWLEQGDTDRALEYLNQYLQAQPEDPLAMLAVARARVQLERYGDALEAYRAALTLLAEDAGERGAAWFEMAAVLLTEVEDPQSGLTALEEAMVAGFRDQEAISGLLARGDLLERERVEEQLRGAGLGERPGR